MPSAADGGQAAKPVVGVQAASEVAAAAAAAAAPAACRVHRVRLLLGHPAVQPAARPTTSLTGLCRGILRP